MSAHTPAPWKFQADGLTVVADGTPIADVRCSSVADDAIDANGLLIAAAPELLSALGTLSMIAAELLNITALAKRTPAEQHSYDAVQAAIDTARAALAKVRQ